MAEPSSPRNPKPRELGIIESISDALAAVSRFSTDQDNIYCYRGHGSMSWQVEPSIFRQAERVRTSEYLIVRDLQSRFPDEFLHDRSMFDRLVRMQHFGLPTRLMDVSRNLLVALHFATEDLPDDGGVIVFRVPESRRKYFDSDSISCICNLANLKESEKVSLRETKARSISAFHELQAADRLYQFIREEKPHFRPRIKREDLSRPYYVVPKLNNRRIIAQNGAFLAFGLEWGTSAESEDEIAMYAFRVPASAKVAVRNELTSLGINQGSLFPEIDKASQQIILEYT